ncbi:MAG: FtsH protease activity modulator HflK [Geminicoccaceae bacterium]|nr:MAG: FtsH protease activity modulator HflK [Geminicoccaceae bacterium]
MPWNNQGGKWQGGGQGPWGGRPSSGGPSGGGQQPPDLEELIRKGQEKFKQMFPGGSGGGMNKGLILAGVAVLAGLWLASGFYRVEPAQRGVELMFGRFHAVTEPGLRYHLPWPIQTVIRPEVERVNRIEVGFRSATAASPQARAAGGRDMLHESLMLTGDENIVDIHFAVLWRIAVPEDFLFNVRDQEQTIVAAAESVMRELVGRSTINDVTTEGRGVLESDARAQLQTLLDGYGAGIIITEVQLQKADPPAEVIDAFRDVQRAQADRERLQNEAEAFANDIIPRARGEAEQIIQQAEGYREEVVARATGDASRFLAVWEEYSNAREVTARRIYLETMETVLRDMNKLVVDTQMGGSGVVPFLPLPMLDREAVSQRPVQTTQQSPLPGLSPVAAERN